ncbi:MAG: signal recognition particle-docking protein FtsY [Gemmatimonadota bacterium]
MSRLFRKKGDTPRRSLWQRIKDVALTDVTTLVRREAREGSLEKVEELLLEADFGVPVTVRLVGELERLSRLGQIKSHDDFLSTLVAGIRSSLESGNSATSLRKAETGPTVILVVGVNGAGKTTFIGKLASRLRTQGNRVLLGAADTFRAGAIDQLRIWAERTNSEFVGGQAGSDPAAIAFDAIDAGVTRNCDYVIIDTAGRLHTSDSLMSELRKVARVVTRRLPDAPHETLLVLDGTIGQNAVSQARVFAEAVPVSGLVVTKVDGTARGGIVVAVHEAIDVPVKFIGNGEKVTDLEPFDAGEFAEELVSTD